MTDERTALATRIKEYRNQENLNQFDFAEDCGISKETLSLIERENANVRLDTVQLLACRMGVTVAELFQQGPVTYIIIPSQITVEGKTHTTYGIGAVKDNILIDHVPDISTQYNKVKSLVLLCNEENLSPCHLHDIAEDAVV